jgi:hypothetical protein
MNARRPGRACAILIASACITCVQPAAGQAKQEMNPAAPPPKIINIVYQGLIPGKEGAYATLLTKISRAYSHANIPVYWVESSSLSGDKRVMSLNFFDSFADMDTALEMLGNATAAHPEIAAMQEDLLADTTDETNAFAIRRDDIGYHAATIDFSKARILRVATVIVRQGYESEFAEAMKSLAAAYEQVRADSPWVLYQVNAGAPSSTFVFFMPMSSMKDMDDYIMRGKALSSAEGSAVEARMQQVARDAYESWDSELFLLSPRQSHVPTEFAAGDPEFWSH